MTTRERRTRPTGEWMQDAAILAKVKKMWHDGVNARLIGAEVNVTRNAILGYIHRNQDQFPREKITKPTTSKHTREKAAVMRCPVKQPPKTNIHVLRKAGEHPDCQTKPQPDYRSPTAKSFAEMSSSRTCNWPIHNPKTPEFHFCGALRDVDGPYCAHHHARAHKSMGVQD